jgi:multiple sugar transport system ATP-binding protein
LQLRKFPKEEIRRRVEDAAQLLELTSVLDRKPKALSGGQRQRVAVGRAIVRKPKVFLFDEPLSNLDAKLRVQMRTEISRLHQRLGATMIYVTHDQTEAMTMADRIVLMKDGHVQQVDGPLEIYHGPKNKFTAGFIGSPAMNFIDGKIERRRGLVFCEHAGPVQLAIPKRLEPRLKAAVGQEVVLGIRPEHLSRVPVKAGSTMKVTVDVVEPMGNEVYVYFVTRPGGPQHVARLSADDLPQRGKHLALSIDAAKLHFFDKQTELAI